ncbi:MAG: tRNA threonylcarbamoyladenosine dehydratase, partial [Marinilabiliales bacterium]
IVGTISYMPNVYGAFIASVVIRRLLDMEVHLTKRMKEKAPTKATKNTKN